MEGDGCGENGNNSRKILESEKKQHHDPSKMQLDLVNGNLDGPFIMPLLPIPNTEHLDSKASVILTGTAKRGGSGPPVGALDIGASDTAYFFRVALPGVRKDPGQFSCEIERDGKVHLRGVTSTGGGTVSRNSRVYKMIFRQQCPPGPFTVSFNLPGAVDPRLFSLNFRSDGVLEGIVMKCK